MSVASLTELEVLLQTSAASSAVKIVACVDAAELLDHLKKKKKDQLKSDLNSGMAGLYKCNFQNTESVFIISQM